MQAPAIPVTMTQDIDAITAKFDADYAVCLRQQRVQFDQNAVDFSFLCENLKTLNKGAGKESDDVPTWSTFVEEVKKRLNNYAEFRQRAGTVQADVDRRIVINLKLTAEEIAEAVAEFFSDVSRLWAGMVDSPAYSDIGKTFGQSVTSLFDQRVQNTIRQIQESATQAAKTAQNGITSASRTAANLIRELETMQADASSQVASARGAANRIIAHIESVQIPSSIRREAAIAEFYASEIAKSIKEYVKVIIVDYKIDERMAKVGKVFRWVSIVSAISEILLSNEKVRTAFVKIAELAAGAGLTIASGVAALACGFAYPVCFVLFATLSNYYLPEHVGEAVGEIYDFLV